MQEININDFVWKIDKNSIENIAIPDLDDVKNILNNLGLTNKRFGLLDDPWDKYYEICNQNERLVSSVRNPLNRIHAIYHPYSFDICFIKGFYYVKVMPKQESAKHRYTVYKCTLDEIKGAIENII